MSLEKIEFRIGEKETANYFSNAAALYVLGVGFGFFAYKAQSPFMMGVCFWFSVFMLGDCFRLARACSRLDQTDNLLITMDAEGITHHASWFEPERRSWREVDSFRLVKTPFNETVYFQCKSRPTSFLRQVFLGAPKLDLPLTCVKDGKNGLLAILSGFPAAAHFVPERIAPFEEMKKAA